MRSFRARRSLLAATCALALTALASVGRAAPAFAPPSPQQPGLAVGVDGASILRAKICAQSPCSVDGGVDLGVPAELRAGLARAQLAVVGIGAGRRAIVVTVPGGPGGQSFQAIVVAPLGGTRPKIVFSGLTGLVEGADGVRQGKTVTIFDADASGARRIVVATEREDLDLCGRRAVLSPELLNPADLSLRPAKVQRLSPSERESAVRLSATEAAGTSTPQGGRVLAALGATSALGAPQALTDGRADTAWTENRRGSGRGEFVVMAAPSDLPISGFDVVLAPEGVKLDPANVPRELWLLTRSRIYHVTFPELAQRQAGVRFRITLPKPEKTDCVAQVLESSFQERADARVAVAELSVASEFESMDAKALVAALAGGGERSLGAAAALRGIGPAGFAAIAEGFRALDERGRRVALDVIDSASCETSVPVYLEAFASTSEAHRLHATSRLRRCGAVSAEGLSRGLATAQGEALARYASELALVAPERAVKELTARLASSTTADRQRLRVAIARSARAPESHGPIRQLLADPGAPSSATLDLLRALGPGVIQFAPEAGAALARLAADRSFRTRYLLLGPAAALAAHAAAADAYLSSALAPQPEAESFIRVRALELAPRAPERARAFVSALDDGHVRVREAAANAIAEGKLAAGAPRLLTLLADDPWPLSRRAAALALGALPAEPSGDAALLSALDDDSPSVKTAAAESLGARRVLRAAPALRDHLEDPEQRLDVRRAAAAALGALCDSESADVLWKLVRRVDDPLATVEERALGEASLGAVVRIAPPDLEARLAPLRRGKAAKAVTAALARNAGKRCR